MTTLLLALSACASPLPDAVLLDFSATWCGPCQQMSPLVSKLEREGLPIRKVDVDRNRGLVRRFNVTNIPAFVLVVDGREVDRVVGRTSERRLRSMLARIPRKPEPRASRPRRHTPGERSPWNTATASAERDPAPMADFVSPAVDRGPAEPVVARAKLDSDRRPRVVTASNDGRVDPMQASARLRVSDDGGVNFGSATIVDSRPGRSVLLTCGHVFRNLTDDSTIEVDVLLPGGGLRTETFVGSVIGYDLEADVGLLSIPTAQALPTCEVATLRQKPAVGDTVTSIGCSRGELPTRQRQRVTHLNRYLGPDNLECTGVPVQGRSGGGLFDEDGRVVGVCIAADPKDEEGIYAGLQAIVDLLVRHGLREEPSRKSVPVEREPDVRLASADVAPAKAAASREACPPTASVPASVLDDEDDLAAIQEALAGAEGAEIVCLIRDRQSGKIRRRVVVINRASRKFVAYLTGELDREPRQNPAVASPDGGPRRSRKPAGDDAMEETEAVFASTTSMRTASEMGRGYERGD